MGNVVAINQVSAERVKQLQEEAIKEEMKTFVSTDPDVKAILLKRVSEIISGMSNWDICYHSGYKEHALKILSEGELDELLRNKLADAARSDNEKDVNYRIYDALGEYLSGKLTITIGK